MSTEPAAVHYLELDEWKEVVPMAAVLARKQAEPLMSALVESARKQTLEAQSDEESDTPTVPASLLLQCLIEEAEASPETLDAAITLIAVSEGAFLTASFGESNIAFADLGQGPYADDLLNKLWELYGEDRWPKGCIPPRGMRLVLSRRNGTRLESDEGIRQLLDELNGGSPPTVVRALLSLLPLSSFHDKPQTTLIKQRLPDIERCALSDDKRIWMSAAWMLGLAYSQQNLNASDEVAAKLLLHCLDGNNSKWNIAPFAVVNGKGRAGRGEWAVTLTAEQKQQLIKSALKPSGDRYLDLLPLLVAFHRSDFFTDEELAKFLATFQSKKHLFRPLERYVERMLEELGEHGRKFLKIKKDAT